MGLLSELYQVASIAADPTVPADQAFAMGMHYSIQMRDKLRTHTRSSPLAADSTFMDELRTMEKVWHARSEETLSAVTRGLGPTRRSAGSGTDEHKVTKDVCFFYGMSHCAQHGCKGTKRSHVCPFCQGSRCGSKPGYLEWHLNDLSAPRTIVFKDAEKTNRHRGDWGRSRSPYRRVKAEDERRSPARLRSPRRSSKGAGKRR